jgi:cell division septation protein DedD
MTGTGFIQRAQRWLVPAGTAVWVALGVVLLAAAVRAHPAERTRPDAARPAAETAVRTYVPDFEFRKGREIVLVLVGAAFCGAQREPGFPQAVEDAKLRVRDQAAARGAQFRAVAVSLDWKTDEALSFLEGFGAFDELTVGSNWLNDGARRYIWRDLPGPAAVPQLLVVERDVETEPQVQVRNERVIKRISGALPVIAWVKDGARI